MQSRCQRITTCAIYTALLTALSASAGASEYGCRVLLCLANPSANGGPMAIAECRPTMNQLFNDLSKGRAFPTCEMANSPNGNSYARQVYDPYDPCPATLLPAPAGALVVQGRKNPNQIGWSDDISAYNIVGAAQVSEPQSESGAIGARACVSKPAGNYSIWSNEMNYTVNVFEQLVWQKPQNPRAIDVFVNNQLFQRVRW
jgi:hypothetical protein